MSIGASVGRYVMGSLGSSYWCALVLQVKLIIVEDYVRNLITRNARLLGIPALTHIFLPLGHWCTYKQSTPIRL